MNIIEQMKSGEKYQSNDPYLVNIRLQVRDILHEFNNLMPSDVARHEEIIRNLFGTAGPFFDVTAPFHCDYGFNIHVGHHFFSNFNLTILDEAPVTIGNNVFIGPNVGIYTACHPLGPEERNQCVEWSRPVTIGDNVWIGGGVTICPGATIGEGAVIGAGSVVVKDIPPHTVAVGNPARPVKSLEK